MFLWLQDHVSLGLHETSVLICSQDCCCEENKTQTEFGSWSDPCSRCEHKRLQAVIMTYEKKHIAVSDSTRATEQLYRYSEI